MAPSNVAEPYEFQFYQQLICLKLINKKKNYKMKRSCCESLNAYDEARKTREIVAFLNPNYFDDMVKHNGTPGVHRRFQGFPTMIFYNATQHSVVSNSDGRAVGISFPGGGIIDKNKFATYPECWGNSFATTEREGPMIACEGIVLAADFNNNLGADVNQNKLTEQISDELGEILVAGDWSASRAMAYQMRLKMDVAARYKLTGKIRGCCIPPATSMYDFNLPIKQKEYLNYPYPVEHDILADGDIFTMAWKTHTLAAAKQYLRVPSSVGASALDGSAVAPSYTFYNPAASNGFMVGLEMANDYVYDYKEFTAATGEQFVDNRTRYLSGTANPDSAITNNLSYVGVSSPYRNHYNRDEAQASGIAAAYQSTGGNMFALRRKHVAGGLYFRCDIRDDNDIPAADFEFATLDQGTLYEFLKSDATGTLLKAWLNIKADVKSSIALSSAVLGITAQQAVAHHVAVVEGVWRTNNTTAAEANSNVRAISSRSWYSGIQETLSDGWNSYKALDDWVGTLPVIQQINGYIGGQIEGLREGVPMIMNALSGGAAGAAASGAPAMLSQSAAPTISQSIVQNNVVPRIGYNNYPQLTHVPRTLGSNGLYQNYQQY